MACENVLFLCSTEQNKQAKGAGTPSEATLLGGNVFDPRSTACTSKPDRRFSRVTVSCGVGTKGGFFLEAETRASRAMERQNE